MAEKTYDETHVAEAGLTARRITALVYALQLIGVFIGVTYIAAVIINYVKAKDVKGTWLESHFRWQIRTFWYSLLWAAIGVLTYLLFIGYVILMADGIWIIYRAIKGWLYLRDEKPMYALEVA